MDKNSVLLVEPTAGKIQSTRLPWQAPTLRVQHTPKSGLTAAMTFRPAVILLSLRQEQSNGLQLARAIRRRLGSAPIIVVYGRPTAAQRRVPAAQRDQIRTRWGVDRLIASEPTGSRLGEVVQKLQQARLRRDGSLSMPDVPPPTEPQQAAPAAPEPEPLPPAVRPHELRALMAAAAKSVAAPREEAPTSIPERLLAGLRAFFQRPAA